VTMRFGLLGTGYWAVATQGAALCADPDVDFVGVWGRDPAKAADVAQRYGVRAFKDVDELLADVDAVAMALPPDVQADLAVRAARAGRHLLLDKPLALSVEDADRVVEAVDEAGVASVVFFTQRFSYNVQTFLDTAAGRLWDGARVTMYASIFQPGSPYLNSVWRRERGGLWDIGPHALSLVLPVLGAVEQVAAMAGPHDTSHVLLRHASGAVSTLTLTLAAPPAAVSYEFALYGPDGVVAMPNGEATAVGAFGAATRQLVANVHAGVVTHPCDVRFAREVVEVLARAQSARVPA
jgi:predicted dehydrogenase